METSNTQQTLYLGLANKDHLHLQEISTALKFSKALKFQILNEPSTSCQQFVIV